MRAALLTEIGKPLTLATLEPEPLSYGQVLVRILASGICGAQLQEIDGHKQGGPLPHPLGHEGCGIVEQVGPAVRQVKVGDKVVMHWRKGDGIESEFPRYRLNGDIITGGKVTTFSDYSVCSENRLTPVPAETPVELCALLGCGLSTALGVIENEANLKMGESVLIIGCGGLGLNLILAARMRRASAIVAVDSKPGKGTAAVSMGATGSVCGPWHAGVGKFDLAIDTSGNEEAIRVGIDRLNPSGRFIMVGQPKFNFTIQNASSLFEGEGKTIKATQGGCFQPTRDIPRFIRLFESGQLNVTGIITHKHRLDFINEGITRVRNGKAGRVLITP